MRQGNPVMPGSTTVTPIKSATKKVTGLYLRASVTWRWPRIRVESTDSRRSSLRAETKAALMRSLVLGGCQTRYEACTLYQGGNPCGHNGCVIIAAADGSSLSNPGPAGWSWYIDDEHWASGGWPRGTNNMGELMAVLDLLRATAVDADQGLRILCDSQYVINSVTKWMPGWKRRGWRKKDGKPVLNVELLRAIDEALEGRDVSFEWVKGHAGHRMNEAADARARAAATAFQQHREPDPGPGYRPGAPGGGSGRAPAAASVLGAPDPVAAEPDLFSEPPRPRDELAEVWDAERSLLTASVRSDQDLLRVLLHPDFVEHDANGRIWTRSRLIAQIAPLERETRLEPLGATRLGPGAVLLRWRATTRTASSLRSSVWVRDDALGRPRWRLLFAQGTATRS